MPRSTYLVLLFVVGCGTSAPPAPSSPSVPTPITANGLHNVFRVSEKLLSGSSPEGEPGFTALRELGVKTIISVDGAAPEVETAKRFGIRYVHVPVGYDGIPAEKSFLLARAARDLPGPIYVHCHHGKHRGPAAVAAIALCTDPTWTPETAEKWLKIAGTDPRYRGLIRLPQSLVRPSNADLDRVPNTFPERASVANLTRTMVEIDARWDRLKLVSAANWSTPKDHPDISPAHEALQLAEQYRELARLPESERRGAEFLNRLRESEVTALLLEQALRATPPHAIQAKAAFTASANFCGKCHAKFRD